VAAARTEPAAGRKRLFLALWPDAAQRAALIRLQSAWAWPPAARPVAAGRLHLTLHFLGDVDDAALPPLLDALGAVRAAAGRVVLERLRLWPGGVAVAEGRADASLTGLHAGLGEAVAQAGVATQARPWTPHVTLARDAASARAAARHTLMPWSVDRFVLVWSQPARGYLVLQEWPLAG
jgi:RNA 2',3'-cyclic 3'-phosphodiesterase